MSCSTCNKWSTCNECDNNADGSVIKQCFDGDTVRVSAENLYRYLLKNKEKRLSHPKIVWLDAVKVDDKLYNVRYIAGMKRNGGTCILTIKSMQAYFSSSSWMYRIYYNGINLSMKKDKFEEMFKCEVQTKRGSSFGFLY